MSRAYLPVFFIVMSLSAYSQRIENQSAVFDGGRVTVRYDIAGGNPKQTYSIRLLSSHNNFTTPLGQVTGDIGEGISAGTGKSIVWNAESELGSFRGNITFRVSGTMIPLKLAFLVPAEGSEFKRGKSAGISWEGGKPSDNIQMELVQNGQVVEKIGEVKNTGAFNWGIDKKLAKGEYQLRLTDGPERVTSHQFMVKAKVGTATKVASGVALGVIVWLLLPDPPPPDPKLPSAPDPQ